MSSVVISGNTSGSVSLVAPDVAGSSVQTLASVSGTLAPLVSGTAVTASGTSVDFTGIPSWVKRITVMFNGVSTNGTSPIVVQLGDSGGIENTGYTGACFNNSAATTVNFSSSFYAIALNAVAGNTYSGQMILNNFDGFTYVESSVVSSITTATVSSGSGSKSLSATLDRIRITTVNGTDTFDAGTINIMYE